MKIPVEILPCLTKHLDTLEILKLRLVCKTWRCYIEEFCLDELILFINVYPTLELWKSNSEPIDFKRMLFFASDRCLSDERFKNTFRNVKKLFLTIRNKQKASYRIDFARLQHLEITRHNSNYHNDYDLQNRQGFGGTKKCKAGFELNLNSLKILYVNTLCNGIALNCPNLSELSFHLIYPSFSRPIQTKKIKKLTCFYFHPWVKQLENLETLVCHRYYDEHDPFFFKYFPRLKFLYFFCLAPNHHTSMEEERIRLERLERNDLKIFYFGKEGREFVEKIDWYRWINWSVFDCGNVFAYYYANELTKLSSTLPTYSALYYDPSFHSYDRRFYQRLVNVQALSITQGLVTQAKLIELVGCLQNIVILWVNEGEQLDNDFYNILPDYYPHLRAIQIDSRRLDQLDLNFLFRLNDLYRVRFKKGFNSIKTRPDYKELAKKLFEKKREIARINGDLLFEIDRLKLDLENVGTFFSDNYIPLTNRFWSRFWRNQI